MKAALVLALVALAVAGAGCGEEEEATSTTPSTTTEATSEPQTTTEEAQGEKEDGFTVKQVGPGQSAASLGADPKSALEAFFVSGDPDLVCGELATEALLSSAYGDEKGCRQAQVPGATPKAIEIDALDVTDDEAMATVIPEGGPNDGIETTVELVDDGGWRVDSLEADIPAGP